MSISLSIESTIGLAATYHVIQNVTLYPMDGSITVTTQGYLTQDDFNNGKSPVLALSASFPYSDLSAITLSSLTEVYAFLVTLPQWQGGTII